MRKLWSKLCAPVEHIRDGLTEAQWDLLRAVVVFAVVGGLGTGVYFLGEPLWRRWQNRQALAQAGQFAAQKDYRSMILALRRATELEPVDFATWREVERYLAEIGSPDSLIAYQQMAHLSPGDMSLRLALIQDALRFGRLETAAEELAGLDAAARRDVAFHRLAAALAAAQGHADEYQAQVAAIAAAEPRNLNARFTLASLRLWGSDPVQSAAAKVQLGDLLSEPTVRVRAAVELLMAAGHERDPVAMRRLLGRLLGLFAPGTPADFATANPPAWSALLRGLESAAAPIPSDAALMARWLADMGRTDEALAWLSRLPPASRNAPVVLDVAAELDASSGRLGALDLALRHGAWGSLPDDTVSLALAAHIEAGRYDQSRGRATWRDAIASCANSSDSLRALARLAEIWRDGAERDEALEAALARDASVDWAYFALRNDYTAGRDLSDLWELDRRRFQVTPNDRNLAAEWILLGCVLNRASSEDYARAESLLAAEPGSRLAVVVAAAALWRQDRPQAAWQVLSRLSEAERGQPSVAFWVALIQLDLGNRQEAATALSQAYRRDLSDAEQTMLGQVAGRLGLPARSN